MGRTAMQPCAPSKLISVMMWPVDWKKGMLVVLGMIVLVVGMYGQGRTFSILYDVEANPEGLWNYLYDMEYDNGRIYSSIYSAYNSNGYYWEMRPHIVLMDTTGRVLKMRRISTEWMLPDDNLLIEEDSVYFFGVRAFVDSNREYSSYVKVFVFDRNLNVILDSFVIRPEVKNLQYIGAIKDENNFYIVSRGHEGEERRKSRAYGAIIKYSISERSVKWLKKFYLNDISEDASLRSGIFVNDLQITPKGLLAFIMGVDHDGILIYEITKEGNVVRVYKKNAFYYGALYSKYIRAGVGVSLRVLSNGDYILHYMDNNIYEEFKPCSVYHKGYYLNTNNIISVHSDRDTFEIDWYTCLSNYLKNTGMYKHDSFTIAEYYVSNIVELQNGDVIVAGIVELWDEYYKDFWRGKDISDGGYTGFIGRIDKYSRQFKWLRFYRVSNDLIPRHKYGRYQFTTIDKISVLEDGRILAAGMCNPLKFKPDLEMRAEVLRAWYLMVDSNGCLEGHPCENYIRIHPLRIYPYHKMGTVWTYETVNPKTHHVGYRDYEIIDTVQWHGRKAFVIESSTEDSRQYMWVDYTYSKIYFWDETKQAWELNYDFLNDSFYYIEYVGEDSTWVDSSLVVYVDSFRKVFIKGVSHYVQYVRSEALPTYRVEVLQGIGSRTGGPRLRFGGRNEEDGDEVVGLRCYSVDSVLYRFMDVRCDREWFVTGVEDVAGGGIRVYPTVHRGEVQVEGVSPRARYRLYDLYGREVRRGEVGSGRLSIGGGVMILEIRDGRGVYRRKLIGIGGDR